MILVTGGAGYVGSHACVDLLNAGEQVVVFDNFCNSNPASLDRVQKICGKPLIVIEGDIRDQVAIERALIEHSCKAVLHFAGLKSVQDSVARPGTSALFRTAGIFESGATHVPLDEADAASLSRRHHRRPRGRARDSCPLELIRAERQFIGQPAGR